MWRDATLSRLKSPAGTGVWVAAQHGGRSLLEDARAAHDGTAAGVSAMVQNPGAL
jgi:hypothetical protein